MVFLKIISRWIKQFTNCDSLSSFDDFLEFPYKEKDTNSENIDDFRKVPWQNDSKMDKVCLKSFSSKK